jgi:hypothetical protein
VAETQSSLDLERHRDLRGRGSGPWARRAVVAVFAAIAIAALAGAIGQRGGRDVAAAPAAKLEVSGPSRVRGGLYFQALITVRARRSIAHPQLVLNRAWFDGLTINTMEPQASQESATGGGNIAFQYDKLDAGDVMRVWIEYQVNPTTVTRRTQVVELDDGAQELVSLRRRLTVLP